MDPAGRRASAVGQAGAGVSVTAGAGSSGLAGGEAQEGAHANGVFPGGGGMTCLRHCEAGPKTPW